MVAAGNFAANVARKSIEGPVGRRLRLRHPDVVEHGFRLGLHARGKRVQHIGRLVDPTALLPGLRKHFPHRAPKAEAAVPDGQLGIDREPAVPDVQQQLAPRLFALPVAIGDRDELLRSVPGGAHQHQNALPFVVGVLEPDVEVHAVGPDVG